jgi:hypothetical protein
MSDPNYSGEIPDYFRPNCPFCDYPLAGLRHSVCPECGRSLLGRRNRAENHLSTRGLVLVMVAPAALAAGSFVLGEAGHSRASILLDLVGVFAVWIGPLGAGITYFLTRRDDRMPSRIGYAVLVALGSGSLAYISVLVAAFALGVVP